MGKFYDFDFQPLTYEDYEIDALNLCNRLLEFYMEFLDTYNQLCKLLDEMTIYQDKDIKSYVVSRDAAKYFIQKICVLSIQEREIYFENQEILPYLEEHIKRRFKLRGSLDVSTFSPMDPFIFDDFSSIKDKYSVIRMIRALKLYRIYNEGRNCVEFNSQPCSDDQIMIQIPYDYSDIECIQTFIQFKDTFTEDFDIHLCNWYKCLFSFTNPRVEYIMVNIDFADPFIQLYELGNKEEHEKRMKNISSKVIHALIAIEHNKIINHKNGEPLICDEPSKKRLKKLNEFLNSKDDLYLLYAFLLQSYDDLPLETIQDLDHLFSEMCTLNDKQYNDIKLSQKVVNYFFRRDVYNQNFDDKRVRKDNQ